MGLYSHSGCDITLKCGVKDERVVKRRQCILEEDSEPEPLECQNKNGTKDFILKNCTIANHFLRFKSAKVEHAAF